MFDRQLHISLESFLKVIWRMQKSLVHNHANRALSAVRIKEHLLTYMVTL